jgi:signal transduction histidine kinase
MADRDKLRQILLNLCKNAVEAMPNGGTLTLRSYAREEWLCLDIADTGDGIPEAMPIFEPAVTNKPQSSGLGLAIVREIVKQHKGTVSYTTQWGKGTTFHLKFPIHAGQTGQHASRPRPWQDGIPRGRVETTLGHQVDHAMA